MTTTQSTLDFREGRRRQAEGLARLEKAHEDFLRCLRSAARTMLATADTISTDDLRAWADAHFVKAPTEKLWGAVLRHRNFTLAGRTRSVRPENHGREIRTWRMRH